MHFAEYTEYMQKYWNKCDKNVEYKLKFLRRYGYGFPNLQKAKLSIQNFVTLICKKDIQLLKKTYKISQKLIRQ